MRRFQPKTTVLLLALSVSFVTSSIGCFDDFGGECGEAQPSSQWLEFSIAPDIQPAIGEQVEVGMVFFHNTGKPFVGSFENWGECQDSQPRTQPFRVLEATCDDGSCEVVEFRSMDGWGVVTIVPRSELAVLHVVAEHETKDLQATGTVQIRSVD